MNIYIYINKQKMACGVPLRGGTAAAPYALPQGEPLV